MHRSDPKTHIDIGVGPICGSKSLAASWRGTTCSRCDSRAANLVGAIESLLKAVEAGKPARRAAAKLRRIFAKCAGEENVT